MNGAHGSERISIRKPGAGRRLKLAGASALLAAMVLCAWPAAQAADAAAKQPPAPAPAVVNAACREGAASLNAFGLHLYSRLASKGKNLFFSPWSLSSSLGVAYAGARGKTRREMSASLGFPEDEGRFRRCSSALGRALGSAGEDGGLKLTEAKSLWIDAGFGFNKEYLGEAKGSMGASLHSADFRRHPEAERGKINSWVKEATGGMIEELLDQGMVSASTALVIADALYFSGTWSSPFDPARTSNGPFIREDGSEVSVPMMSQQGRFRTLHSEGVRMIELPYGKGGVSMVVLLPDAERSLAETERGLTPYALGRMLDALSRAREGEAALMIPRFSLSTSCELSRVLSGMGMCCVFNSRANFSGMTGVKGLYISLVAHKARVEVDEKGTTAAAATGVVMTKGVKVPTVFVADRPFMFLIREKGTGAILFMGRMADPSAP